MMMPRELRSFLLFVGVVYSFLFLLLLFGCTPAQRQAAGQGLATAARTVLDLGRCLTTNGGSPLAKTIARELASDPAARERYRTALSAGTALEIQGVYVGGQDLACLLNALATVIPSSAPLREGGDLIVRRAERCDLGPCEAHDQAAAILRDLWRARMVLIPASGRM